MAAPPGAVHLLDHLSFLGFGLVVWLWAFDPRRTRGWREGIRLGGLPWWARHVHAMVSRLAMLPAAFAIWIAAAGTSHDIDQPWGFGLERSNDQEAAASLMIGFEMILLCIAIVLAFIFVSLCEGRREGSRAVNGVSRLARRSASGCLVSGSTRSRRGPTGSGLSS